MHPEYDHLFDDALDRAIVVQPWPDWLPTGYAKWEESEKYSEALRSANGMREWAYSQAINEAIIGGLLAPSLANERRYGSPVYFNPYGRMYCGVPRQFISHSHYRKI